MTNEELTASNKLLLQQLEGATKHVAAFRASNERMAEEMRGHNGKVRREMDARLKQYRGQLEELLPLARRYVLLRQFPVQSWALGIHGASGENLDARLDDAANRMEAVRSPPDERKGSDG